MTIYKVYYNWHQSSDDKGNNQGEYFSKYEVGKNGVSRIEKVIEGHTQHQFY